MSNAGEADIIRLLILDVIHDLPEYQVMEHFKPGTTSPEPPPDAIEEGVEIFSFQNERISDRAGSGNNLTRLVGIIDDTFSCGYRMTSINGTTFLRTHLIVLKVEPGRLMDFASDSTYQLYAYLAIMQRGQEMCNHHFGQERSLGISYGVISNNGLCRFIELKPDKTV